MVLHHEFLIFWFMKESSLSLVKSKLALEKVEFAFHLNFRMYRHYEFLHSGKMDFLEMKAR